MGVIIVTSPGVGNNIKPNTETAINAVTATDPAFPDVIFLPTGAFNYIGNLATSKKNFVLTTLIPAQCTWNGFSNNYLTEPNALTWSVDPSCILYRDESQSDASLADGYFLYVGGSSRSNCGIKICDIEFRSKIPSEVGCSDPVIAPSDGKSMARDYALSFNKCIDLVITRCKFKYFGNAAIEFKHYDDTARGLIYKCDFYHNAKGVDGLGYGYGIVVESEDLSWSRPADFGTDNFLFVENCTGLFHRHFIAGGGCGAYVIRNCYIQDTIFSYYNSTQAIDGHGRRGGSPGNGNYFSTRCMEVYNNKIINTKLKFRDNALITGGTTGSDLIEVAINLKESEHLSYNNIVAGFRFGSSVYIETPNIYNAGYPQLYTMGYASGISGGSGTPNGDAQDSWIWSNNVHLLDGTCTAFNNYSPSNFTANRDYHLATFSYTAYTYPHPRRDDLVVIPPVGTGRRNFRKRTYHSNR